MAVEDWTPNLSRVCPVCGKVFLPAWQHAWRDKTDPNGARLVCTYHCMRETERRAEEAAKLAKDGRRYRHIDPNNMTEKQRRRWKYRECLKCPVCQYSKEVVGETEASVYCTHPDQERISEYWRSHHMPGRIGYLGIINRMGEYHFTRTPKWCPIRQEVLENETALRSELS